MSTKIVYADFNKKCDSCGNTGVNVFPPMSMCMPCVTGESDTHEESIWEVIFNNDGSIKQAEDIQCQDLPQ